MILPRVSLWCSMYCCVGLIQLVSRIRPDHNLDFFQTAALCSTSSWLNRI